MKIKKGIKIDQFLVDRDDEVIARYHEEGPWGLACAIDLHQCDKDMIKDEKTIKRFAKELISFIDMKGYDKPYLMNFGKNPRVTGISMFHFIETSNITAHFANETASAYIDIFSCGRFRPHEAAAFCKKFFRAVQMKVQIIFRE